MVKRVLPKPPSFRQTVGPSFVLLGLALGSGELILWPYLAANYGLGLLWGALLGITFQFFLNTEVMRYSLAWGESVFVGFRKISRLIPLWFVVSTFIPWSLPGFSSASTDIINHFFPSINKNFLAVGLLILVGLILSLGKSLYKTVETFQKTIIFIGLPFIFGLVITLSSSSDYLNVFMGLVGRGDGYWFFPPAVAVSAFLGAFAYAGAGGNLNLAQSYYVKEKGFGMGRYSTKISSLLKVNQPPSLLTGNIFTPTLDNRQKWKSWWKLINQEHLLVFWFLGLLTIVMLSLLSKITVYEQASESGLSFLFLEAGAIGQKTLPLFRALFLMLSALMLFSTQLGVLESSSRIISENVAIFLKPLTTKMNLSLYFYIALWSQILLGCLIYLTGFSEPRSLITLSALLNALAMMVSFPLVYILNRRFLRPEMQPPLFRVSVMAFAFLFFLYFLITLIIQ